MGEIWPAIITLIPSVGIGFLGWMILKHILEGDRRERLAHAQWDADQEARQGADQGIVPPDSK